MAREQFHEINKAAYFTLQVLTNSGYFFFGANLVEGSAAFFYAVPSVRDAPILENFLEGPVLAESSVNCKKRKIDIIG